jgi:L-ribulose-5-phosphate 3-epimerase UlaE
MTLQQAKSIARDLGLTLRELCSGEYRVNFRDGNETTAHYRDNLEDAVNTAVEMARKRALELHRTEPGRDVASPAAI